MPIHLGAIHQNLILRLTLVATLLSTLLGTAAYLYERRQLQNQVMEMAKIGVEVSWSKMSRRLLSVEPETDPTLPRQQVIADLPSNPPRSDLGRFAFVVFYDASQHEIGRATDSPSPDAQRFASILAGLQPGRAADRLELGDRIAIGKAHGLPFVFAIPGDRGRAVGYVKGIFVPSTQKETEMRRTARRASALAIGFVIVTALIVYPTIRSLIIKLEKQTEQLVYANIDTLKVLGSAVAKRDSDTDAHNYRVTFYSVRLAEAVGLNEKHIRALIKGAFLHDVGKIAIRDSVLLKPGSLDSEEHSEMQSHVRHGLDIVENASWLADAAQVVGGHHEKYDGSGYPNRLAGEAIPLTARIFAIADVFDALTSERPYKKPMLPDEALAIMRQDRGRHFDPALFSAFEPLAPTLYAAIHAKQDVLHRMLKDLVRRYFVNMLKEKLDEAVDGEGEPLMSRAEPIKNRG